MKRLLFFLTLFLLSFPTIYAQSIPNIETSYEVENSYKFNIKNGTDNIKLFYESPNDPAGAIPGLTSYWDYVTNGNNLKRIWVMGDTVIVAADWVDSLNAQNGSSRRTKYQVSYDGGLTWLPEAIQITEMGSCYPDLSIINFQGKKTVLFTGREYVTQLIGYTGLDSTLGTGKMRVNSIPYTGRDYFSSKLSDSLIAGCYNSSDSLWFLQYNFVGNVFGNRVLLGTSAEYVTSSFTRYFIANSINSQKIFVMWCGVSFDTVVMIGRESTNGGGTFGNVFAIVPHEVLINGTKVSSSSSGDVLYIPTSNVKCAAVSTIKTNSNQIAQVAKLVFWSPDINNGTPVVIADWTNIPVLHDTATYNSNILKIQYGNTAVSHPSLAYSDDGSTLFCVFSVVQEDTTWYSFRYNDIWCSYSTNDGETWEIPFSLTDTYNEDEIYPSISKTGNTIQGSTATIHVTYLQSNLPGSASIGDNTPVCKNYNIYRKFQIILTKLNAGNNKIPKIFSLYQNYPNPFNPKTTIKYDLPKDGFVTFKVYDVLGKEMFTTTDFRTAGTHQITLDGTNYASGLYFYRIEVGNPETSSGRQFMETKKMVLVK